MGDSFSDSRDSRNDEILSHGGGYVREDHSVREVVVTTKQNNKILNQLRYSEPKE